MTESSATESALRFFSIRNNHLVVGGRPVEDWIKIYGSPCYLYDRSVIRRKVALFREVMPAEIKLYYAVKANPHHGVLKEMAGLVDGFDVASGGELESVLKAGGDAETISFAGPGKRRSELELAIKTGIGSINVESEQELEIVGEEGKKLGVKPKVSIRINPDFELHGAGMKMGGTSKQFGIDSERVPEVLDRAMKMPVDLQGFHIYAGSQCLMAEVLYEVFEKSLDLFWHFGRPFAERIQLLNLGGGFGIPYYRGEVELGIGTVGEHLKGLLSLYGPRFPKAKFVIELGRYLTGECGVYVTRVLYRKVSRGKVYLITDGGMNHHLAASGNFGQILRKNYPIVNGNKVHSEEGEEVRIVGPLCTPLDLIASNISLPLAKVGDLLLILSSGAYGASASPQFFLGHPLPPEIIV